jgi:Delta3-Delta2-enoyl-CoA isomerase
MAMATGGDAGAVRIERNPKGFATLWLGSEPVNSMTLDLWKSLLDALTTLEKDPSTRGVVFASALRKDIFTAGNDIKELHAKSTSESRYREFWRTQTTFLCRLLRSPLATVCAIRGACPAGGCAVALCCDYRIQSSESGTFGLNEVALGIPVPKFWAQRFVACSNDPAKADLTLQLGKLLTPGEAKMLGLLDEVVPAAALMPAATRAMENFLKTPDGARHATKVNVRGEFSAAWEAYIEEEASGGWAMLSTPEVEATLGKVIERLSGNKRRAKL